MCTGHHIHGDKYGQVEEKCTFTWRKHFSQKWWPRKERQRTPIFNIYFTFISTYYIVCHWSILKPLKTTKTENKQRGCKTSWEEREEYPIIHFIYVHKSCKVIIRSSPGHVQANKTLKLYWNCFTFKPLKEKEGLCSSSKSACHGNPGTHEHVYRMMS